MATTTSGAGAAQSEPLLLGKQQLLQWAQTLTSVEPCTKYDDMKDGFIPLALFLSVFPSARRDTNGSAVLEQIVKASTSSNSNNSGAAGNLANRSKQAWDCIRRIVDTLRLPKVLFDWRALQAGTPRNTYNLLVMLYFLSKLTETTDFSVDFAHPIDDNLSAFLQSANSLEVLVRAGCSLPNSSNSNSNSGNNNTTNNMNNTNNTSGRTSSMAGGGNNNSNSTSVADHPPSSSMMVAGGGGADGGGIGGGHSQHHHLDASNNNQHQHQQQQQHRQRQHHRGRSTSPMPPVSTPTAEEKRQQQQHRRNTSNTGNNEQQKEGGVDDDVDDHRRQSYGIGVDLSPQSPPRPPSSSSRSRTAQQQQQQQMMTTTTRTRSQSGGGSSTSRSGGVIAGGVTTALVGGGNGGNGGAGASVFTWPSYIEGEIGTTAVSQLKARLASTQQECEMLRQQLRAEKDTLAHHLSATEHRRKIEAALQQQRMADLAAEMEIERRNALARAEYETYARLRTALAETESVRELAVIQQQQQQQSNEAGAAVINTLGTNNGNGNKAVADDTADTQAADKEARVLLTAQVETLNTTLAEAERLTIKLRQTIAQSTERLSATLASYDETSESLVRNIEYDLGDPSRDLNPEEACVIRALEQVNPADRVAILTYLRQLRLQLSAAKLGAGAGNTSSSSSTGNNTNGSKTSSSSSPTMTSSSVDVWPRKEVIVVEQSVALERAQRKSSQLEMANTYLRETVARLMAHEPALSEAAERDYGAQLLSEIAGVSIEVPSTVIKSIPIDTLCAQTHANLSALRESMLRQFPEHECTQAADQLTTRFWCLTGALCALQRRLENAAQTVRHMHRASAEASRAHSVLQFNHKRELITLRRDLEEQMISQSRESEVREAGLQLRIQMCEEAKTKLASELSATQKRGEENCHAVLQDVDLFQNGAALQNLSLRLREVTAELQSTLEGNRRQEESIISLKGQAQQMQQQLRSSSTQVASGERRIAELETEGQDLGHRFAVLQSESNSLRNVALNQRKELEQYASSLHDIFSSFDPSSSSSASASASSPSSISTSMPQPLAPPSSSLMKSSAAGAAAGLGVGLLASPSTTRRSPSPQSQGQLYYQQSTQHSSATANANANAMATERSGPASPGGYFTSNTTASVNANGGASSIPSPPPKQQHQKHQQQQRALSFSPPPPPAVGTMSSTSTSIPRATSLEQLLQQHQSPLPLHSSSRAAGATKSKSLSPEMPPPPRGSSSSPSSSSSPTQTQRDTLSSSSRSSSVSMLSKVELEKRKQEILAKYGVS